MKLRNTVIGTALFVAAFGSSALSLGRAKGNAVLGQPLDVSFDVRLDSPDDSSAPCMVVDILHGDVRTDPSRTRISVEPTAQPQEVVVRVRSSTIVDEPLVSVILRAGCTQNTTRRYEFLSDFPSEARASVPALNASQTPPPAVAVAPAPVPAAPRPEPAAPAVQPREEQARPPVRTAPPVVRAPRPPAPPAAARAAPAIPRSPEAETARPRLRLEAPQLLPERQAGLKASPGLNAPPPAAEGAVPAQRAEAAAMWRALNAEPQELVAEAKRLQDLEASNKALREQSARNEARFAELTARMQKMEEERFGTGLVYGLGALLALALAAIAFLLLRRREPAPESKPQWWGPQEMAEEDGANAGVASSIPVSVTSQSVAKPELTEVDVDLRDSDSAFAAFVPGRGAAASPPAGPVAASQASTAVLPRQPIARSSRGAINPEELFDVQQHAEFFVSLGQYEQAIDVLRKHIRENPESSPLAYLDLLKIYHTLSRPEDYNGLRAEFNRIFNGRIPAFAAFSSEGRLLEDYPAVLGDIQQLWPAAQVVDLIEEYLFPQPAGQGGAAFDLAAFRELMLLHAIAKSVAVQNSSAEESEAADSRLAQARKNRLSSTAPVSDFSHSDLASVSAVLSSQAIELYSPAGDPLADISSGTSSEISSDYPSDIPPLSAAREEAPSPSVDLDLDLSEMEVHRNSLNAPLDLEFPDVELPEPAVAAKSDAPADKQADRGNLIDFDLFDPGVEADIKPKPTRH